MKMDQPRTLDAHHLAAVVGGNPPGLPGGTVRPLPINPFPGHPSIIDMHPEVAIRQPGSRVHPSVDGRWGDDTN